MRVLITGASGFLGEWVVKRCIEKSYAVSILCRPTSDLSKINELNINKCYGSLDDISSLEAACENIDLVIHLAGKIAYKKSEYQSMWQTNVTGTANLLKAMQTQQITEMIYMSSVVAIGASYKPVILNEESTFEIEELGLGYFNSKHTAENLVLQAFNDGWLRPVIINPATIYGPGDATKSSRKIQLKVAMGKFPFYTAGGVNVVYIKDVIDLMFKAYDKKLVGERILAAGENIRIKELFALIAEASGQKKPNIYLPTPLLFIIGFFGDLIEKFGGKGPISLENARTATMYHWFANDKAKNKLGMQFTPAKQAIKESIKWAKQHDYL